MNNLQKLILIFIAFFSLAGIPGCKNEILPPAPRGPVWLSYTRANSPILSNRIYSVLIDGEGTVWFGTDSGAVYNRKGSWGAITDSLEYPGFGSGGISVKLKAVKAMAEGMDGSLWFGLEGGGVRRYSRNSSTRTWQRYGYPDVLSEYITSIGALKGLQGDVWVGTTVGVTRYIPGIYDPTLGEWQTKLSSRLPSTEVRALAVNPLNNWICFGTAEGAEFYDSDKNQWSYFPLPDSFNTRIISIAFDLTNTVWLGKWEGLTSFNMTTGVKHHYTFQNTNGKFPSGYVNAVAADFYSSAHWFGTNKGLIRLVDTTWTTFTRSTVPELPSDSVLAVSVDRKGNLWIGTLGGIAVYNEQGTQF